MSFENTFFKKKNTTPEQLATDSENGQEMSRRGFLGAAAGAGAVAAMAGSTGAFAQQVENVEISDAEKAKTMAVSYTKDMDFLRREGLTFEGMNLNDAENTFNLYFNRILEDLASKHEIDGGPQGVLDFLFKNGVFVNRSYVKYGGEWTYPLKEMIASNFDQLPGTWLLNPEKKPLTGDFNYGIISAHDLPFTANSSGNSTEGVVINESNINLEIERFSDLNQKDPCKEWFASDFSAKEYINGVVTNEAAHIAIKYFYGKLEHEQLLPELGNKHLPDPSFRQINEFLSDAADSSVNKFALLRILTELLRTGIQKDDEGTYVFSEKHQYSFTYAVIMEGFLGLLIEQQYGSLDGLMSSNQLDTDNSLISLLHDIGATPDDVVALMQKKAVDCVSVLHSKSQSL